MPRIGPFEEHSEAYDEWFATHAEAYAAELAAVRELMPPFQSAVEVGVGSGKFAVPFGIDLGVEPSPAMAKVAREQGIRVLEGVAEDLPFKDGSFDLVLMVTTVCFVDDVLASFREAFRVLQAGGHILVGFVDRDSDLGQRYEADREKSKFYNEATFVTADGVVADLTRAGFRQDAARQTLIPGEPPQTVLPGYGRGAFVVVRGLKARS